VLVRVARKGLAEWLGLGRKKCKIENGKWTNEETTCWIIVQKGNIVKRIISGLG
jgi:hypothetical protein